jgi:hypothetical protein
MRTIVSSSSRRSRYPLPVISLSTFRLSSFRYFSFSLRVALRFVAFSCSPLSSSLLSD